MSHFTVVASTNDYVYGQTGAKNLAISDPSKAINNADNHEYFAENTPALP
jgi:peptidyl-Lys metalloendopeptidase